MNKKKEEIDQDNSKEPDFSKEQILESKTIPYNKDVLNSLLSGEKRYTLKELKQMVIDFNNRRCESCRTEQ